MELAKERLTLSTDSIIEIVDQCGFSGVPSFSRKFKQEFGLAPSLYRKNVLKSQLNILAWRLPVDEALFNQLITLKNRHAWLADFFMHTIDNIHNELFRIEQLSNSLFMSSATLNRKIKQLFGISTQRLVLDLRLQYAAEILAEEQKTVTETAFLAGFCDAAHLTRYFKQVFGCSPGSYKSINILFNLIDKLKI